MYILEAIGAVDLITVCLITVACVITMICIIIVSSRSSKKKSVSFAVEEKKDLPFKREELQNKEPVTAVKMRTTPIEEKKEQTKADIQSVLDKMETELESGSKEKVHTFEEEQEEKAIISYKELLKVAGKLKDEIRQNEEEMEGVMKPALIEIQESAEPTYEHVETPEEKKFRSTEFISPVYGRQETVADVYAGKHEEKEDEVFLNRLKDLRKNLE